MVVMGNADFFDGKSRLECQVEAKRLMHLIVHRPEGDPLFIHTTLGQGIHIPANIGVDFQGLIVDQTNACLASRANRSDLHIKGLVVVLFGQRRTASFLLLVLVDLSGLLLFQDLSQHFTPVDPQTQLRQTRPLG